MRGAAREHRQIILIKVDQFERLRTCRGFLAARNSYSSIRNVQLDMFLTIALPAPRPERNEDMAPEQYVMLMKIHEGPTSPSERKQTLLNSNI